METDPAPDPDMRNIIYNLVRKNPTKKELQFVLSNKETFRAEEISLGYVNHVFRVLSTDGKQTFIVKHAEPTARVVKGFELPLERAVVEYNALRWFHTVHCGCSPTPYGFDMESFTVAMEDLGEMDSLLSVLLEGNIDVNTMVAVSAFVAEVHNKTSRHKIQKQEWSKLEAEFRDVGMAGIMSNFVFDCLRNEGNKWNLFDEDTIQVFKSLMSSPKAVDWISQMEKAYWETQDCLVHRDLHSLSILIKQGRFAIHDMEFVGLGPRWFDVGQYLSCFIMAYFHHHCKNDIRAMADIRNVFIAIVEKYLDVASFSQSEMEPFMRNVTYFTALYVFRAITFVGFDKHFSLTPEWKVKVLKTCLDQLNAEPRVMSVLELSNVFFTSPDVSAGAE